MGYQDDVLIKLGIDSSGFQTAISEVGNKFSVGLKEAIGRFLPAIGISSILGFGKSFIKAQEDIAEMSDELGVSIDFIRQWRKEALFAGIDTEKANTALERMAIKLGEASKGEASAIKFFNDLGVGVKFVGGQARETADIFNDLITAINKLPKAERSAAWKDFAGRGGGRFSMVGEINRDSSKDIESQIGGEAAKEVGDFWKRLWHGAGKVTTRAWEASIFGLTGGASTRQGPREKLAQEMLEDRAKNLPSRTIAKLVSEEDSKKELETAKKLKEEYRKQSDALNDKLDKQLKSEESAKRELSNAQRGLSESKSDRSAFTLDEIASGGFIRGNAAVNQQIVDANRAKWLHQMARWARGRGMKGLAAQATEQELVTLGGIESLNTGERYPIRAQVEAIKKQTSHIIELHTEVLKILASLDRLGAE